MDLQLEKIELIELLLNTKEESVLKKLRKILEKNQIPDLTPEQYSIIEQRRENHLTGKSKSYNWDEVKQNALASKK
jgi:Putative addiction module component